jgi:hypothetical protein
MLELADPCITLSTEQASDQACLVAVIDSKVPPRCGVIGAADSASTFLFSEHASVFAGSHAVMAPAFVFHVAMRIVLVPLASVAVYLLAVLLDPLLVARRLARLTHAGVTVVLVFVGKELGEWFGFLAPLTPLCAFRRSMPWWPHTDIGEVDAVAGFASPVETVRPRAVAVEFIERLLGATVTAKFHRFLHGCGNIIASVEVSRCYS